MGEQFTISQLAKAAEVPTSTLRYYERIKLLEPEDRSHGNYRLYTDESLNRLRFIRAAHAIGFTLEDVKALLGVYDGEIPSCRDVQTLIEERLSEIEARLKNLRQVKKVLNSALQQCIETEQEGCCYVIESLSRKV